MGKYIIGIGEILWDMFPSGKKLGGAPGNFVYHVAKQGLNGLVISAVGNDSNGNGIIAKLQEKNINNYIQVNSYPTGTVDVSVDKCGIPTYNINEGVAWDNIVFDSTLKEIAENTRVVCFGTLAQRSPISAQTIKAFIDNIRDEDALKVFDINLRQSYYSKEVIEDSLEMCNVLKINDEELLIVKKLFELSCDGDDELCKLLMKLHNIEILILTLGSEGSKVYWGDEMSYIKPPKIQIADTVGAGDSFTAAFVSSIVKGKSIKEAHAIATEISAFVCSQYGAMPEYID